MTEDELEAQPPRACRNCGGTGYDDDGCYNGLPPGECPTCHGTGDDPDDKR